jgi:hypothetical protein
VKAASNTAKAATAQASDRRCAVVWRRLESWSEATRSSVPARRLRNADMHHVGGGNAARLAVVLADLHAVGLGVVDDEAELGRLQDRAGGSPGRPGANGQAQQHWRDGKGKSGPQ